MLVQKVAAFTVFIRILYLSDRFDFGYDQIATTETIFKLIEENLMLTVHTTKNKIVKNVAPPAKKLTGYRFFENVYRCVQVEILSCITSGRAHVPFIKNELYNKGVRNLPVFVNALCFANKTTPLLE